MSRSINFSQDLLSHSLFTRLILWIEERDSDLRELLAERIIPIGIMGRYQVTLHIAQISIALAIHSLDPLECGD